MNDCNRECTVDSDSHMFEPVFSEFLEKEFHFENWKLHRKRIFKKEYLHHYCVWCGLVWKEERKE